MRTTPRARRATTRAIILVLVAAASTFATRTAPARPTPPALGAGGGAEAPVAVFAELDGTWAGVFVGYDEAGRELYRIRVRQTYETVSATTQRVSIADTMPDGTVIRGAGENVATRRPDGTLRLTCTVRKSNGETVEHDGRLVTGPAGDRQLIWHSRGADRTEIFRETVREEHGGSVYEINGLGRYGGSLVLMHGRYRRQEAGAEEGDGDDAAETRAPG